MLVVVGARPWRHLRAAAGRQQRGGRAEAAGERGGAGPGRALREPGLCRPSFIRRPRISPVR